MTTVNNEVFIGLLHENVYLVGRELSFGGGNCSRYGVNEQSFGSQIKFLVLLRSSICNMKSFALQK